MTKTAAIIGASADRSKFGNKAVRAFRLAGYEVYPVNLHEQFIEGLKAYKSLNEIPGTVDVASVYVRSDVGLTIAPQIIDKGVKEVFLNPGTASEPLLTYLEERGVRVRQECSITAQGFRPVDFT
ncbi:MAG: hypothetical protein A2898_04525 [Candidatus Kerfeldbacteria bacterium RIFCSPLOWO2_01_FULL_48_11]|uniref:CoA-binding domain-containing protein n=1 Tax=Candidatus Kerfeldbacteria bacterium RIFCSPLOWO2_01_FULL_48_11 TaxID=1798543 RepID=A0A1G2B3M2_9BACT|nr:MAG: CoA-binding domain protein [Parcubacteria group bacterium GW2011_GWA2_48_9]OGY82827.1 MAG: hypothetical protein A2898_04525 [Candidatus Kerfeldbacteria bacterium RIFCSPLOWO2_01_FULL_48_11]HCM68565.1 CoA-binding protein [Candidatus Kerfeldbacteria bacterium]